MIVQVNVVTMVILKSIYTTGIQRFAFSACDDVRSSFAVIGTVRLTPDMAELY